MSRQVTLSTTVFSAIWANRKDGEETEDAVLRRLLGCSKSDSSELPPATTMGVGVHDVRNNVRFPEGFIIFRAYKGREYKAAAKNGVWVRQDNGQSYPTLNQLNSSIAAGAENVWNGNWKYRKPDGTTGSINELRK